MGADGGNPEALQISAGCTVPQWPLLGHRAASMQPHCFWTDVHSRSPQDKRSQLPTVPAFPLSKELPCYSPNDFLTQPRRAFSNIWCGIAKAQSLVCRLLSCPHQGRVTSCITSSEGLSCWLRPHPASHMQGLALEKLPSPAGCKQDLLHMLQHAMVKNPYLLPNSRSTAGHQEAQFHCAMRREEEGLRPWPASWIFQFPADPRKWASGWKNKHLLIPPCHTDLQENVLLASNVRIFLTLSVWAGHIAWDHLCPMRCHC